MESYEYVVDNESIKKFVKSLKEEDEKKNENNNITYQLLAEWERTTEEIKKLSKTKKRLINKKLIRGSHYVAYR